MVQMVSFGSHLRDDLSKALHDVPE